jgi:dihydropteroate synthase
LKDQPFNLEKISQSIKETLFNFSRCEFQLEIGGLKLNLGLSKRTFIMGILNLTPDSFSGDGIYKDEDLAMRKAETMVRDGADIIDVGGESTRPGSKVVSAKEEIFRVIPVIKKIARRIKVPISIDTSKSEVADAALDAGAAMVNDIRGLRGDARLAKLIARHKVPVVVMHIKGTPRTMQTNPKYKSLIPEIISSLRRSIQIGLDAGIKMEKIIIDPGIGFGKTTEHNLEILRRLSEFRSLGRPILIGTSRKSFIGNILGLPVEKRLLGSAATVALAIFNGASFIRVHDVKEMTQVARTVDAIVKKTSS